MPDAARISDLHACPKVEPGPVPHVGGPIFTGSSNVIIGYLPAARVGDRVVCLPVGPADSVTKGSTTVLINSCSAARRTDACSHGSRIVAGCPTVIIGDNPQSFALRAAAERGTPFCEECERKRRQREAQGGSVAEPPPEPPAETATLGDDLDGGELSMTELASQANAGDGLDDLRGAARYAVAYRFYGANTPMKPANIWSHLGGIDVSEPVHIVDVSGATLYQHAIPGAHTGQYFSLDPEVSPSQLGISENVYPFKDGVQTPPPVPRDKLVAHFGDGPVLGLQSTAAPTTDRWSMPAIGADPGQQVPCDGGGTQLMIPTAFQTSMTISSS